MSIASFEQPHDHVAGERKGLDQDPHQGLAQALARPGGAIQDAMKVLEMLLGVSTLSPQAGADRPLVRATTVIRNLTFIRGN